MNFSITNYRGAGFKGLPLLEPLDVAYQWLSFFRCIFYWTLLSLGSFLGISKVFLDAMNHLILGGFTARLEVTANVLVLQAMTEAHALDMLPFSWSIVFLMCCFFPLLTLPLSVFFDFLAIGVIRTVMFVAYRLGTYLSTPPSKKRPVSKPGTDTFHHPPDVITSRPTIQPCAPNA